MKNTRSLLPFVLLLINVNDTYGQNSVNDSLFTNYGIIVVEIREVGTESIKYSFPKEDLTNIMPLSALHKIRYKSGRIQLFAQPKKQESQEIKNKIIKPSLKITNEILNSIVSKDCNNIRAKAPCTVSTKCDFRVYNFVDKGQNTFLLKMESIGIFYNITLTLYYEIVIDDEENIKYTLQKVICN